MDDTAPSAGEARRRTSEAVAGLLAGSGLLVEERRGELVISNPRDPGRGWVHVEYADGYVSWERLTWTYWGTLEGLPDTGQDPVDGQQIMDALLGRA